MKNILEQVVAVLDEYSFTRKDGIETYKLYRTKEGNWYEISQSNILPENNKISALKVALNNEEKRQVLD